MPFGQVTVPAWVLTVKSSTVNPPGTAGLIGQGLTSGSCFALANAGVAINADALAAPGAGSLAGAVALGQVAGKVLGIAGTTLLARRLRLGVLPEGVTTRYVWGLAALAGIGFTVSLFIADLAYDAPALTDTAKIGILGGSLLAALLGAGILFPGRPADQPPGPRPAKRPTVTE